ncbi:putative N-acetyltransferase domain-containing protein [Seiridium cardinale]|uniref:N-acetyltransferase domain-containing protein n=1 Tax=Seiridium cardinale TaxID=138064 RepID=A0ABR2XFU6_9PEZI
MHPKLEISLLPATCSDVPELLKVHVAAFQSDQFSNLMLLGRDPNEFERLLSKSIETWMSDPNAQLIKAVAKNGAIVGYACWVTEDGPDVEQDLPKPKEKRDDSLQDAPVSQHKLLPKDLGKLMREDLVSRKKELIGNERHLVLQALITHPQWQGKGIGAQLVQWGTARADAEGLACWAHASPSGHGVYLSAGFEELDASDYDLDRYLPEDEQGGPKWGTYTFRYMIRSRRG